MSNIFPARKDLWIERPIYGYSIDLTKCHIHFFDGDKYYILEKNEQDGKVSIIEDDNE